MGQRHQVFVYAQTAKSNNPPEYRCVAVLHHQWCYGSLPVLAATRFINLVKQSDNASIIRRELDTIVDVDDEGVSLEVPCPYTTFLLQSAWTTELDPGKARYSAMAWPLRASITMHETCNDDGYTIIDITEPLNPAYGFCFWDSEAFLTAKEYIRTYYNSPGENATPHELEWEERLVSAYNAYDTVPLASFEKIMAGPAMGGEPHVSTNPTPQQESRSTSVPTLVSLLLEPCVKHALAGDGYTASHLLQLPHIADAIRGVICTQPVLPDTSGHFITQLLKSPDSDTLDLSGLPLSPNQILSIVSRTKDIKRINLSNNPDVDIQLVETLVLKRWSLRHYVLLNTGVDDHEILKLLDDYPKRFDALIHPAFFGGDTRDQKMVRNAFLYICPKETSDAIGLPYFTPNQIAQGLYDYLHILGTDKYSEGNAYTHKIGSDDVAVTAAAFASLTRQEGQTWGERSVHYVPNKVLMEPALNHDFAWKLIWVRGYMRNYRHRYAFVHTNPEKAPKDLDEDEKFTAGMQICDIKEFFHEMELEARGAVKPELSEKVQALFSCKWISLLTRKELSTYLKDYSND